MKKLVKLEAPTKYAGETDKERMYSAVHEFLSQLSRYLRLVTYVDIDEDIHEYVMGYMTGFALRWLETLDKGNTPFTWKRFEKVFRAKFVLKDHIRRSVREYMVLKQGTSSVETYIIARERIENTLFDVLSAVVCKRAFMKV